MKTIEKIGLGGGCHWCTEAVFQSIKGVSLVEQGFISSIEDFSSLSEGVIVHFDPAEVSLEDLVEIHTHTHESTSNHSFRKKYRSAVYYFDTTQKHVVKKALKSLTSQFDKDLITLVLPFDSFVLSIENFQNYFKRNKEAPFCTRYIVPKIEKLQDHFPQRMLEDSPI